MSHRVSYPFIPCVRHIEIKRLSKCMDECRKKRTEDKQSGVEGRVIQGKNIEGYLF